MPQCLSSEVLDVRSTHHDSTEQVNPPVGVDSLYQSFVFVSNIRSLRILLAFASRAATILLAQNFGEAGYRLEIRSRGESQKPVT